MKDDELEKSTNGRACSGVVKPYSASGAELLSAEVEEVIKKSDNIKGVKKYLHSPNQKVVQMLEELLEEAKKGEIQSLAVAGYRNDATSFNCFSLTEVMVTLTEISILHRDVMDCCVSLRRQPLWEFCE